MTNLGKWDGRYAHLTTPEQYGDSLTYKLGAAHLANQALIEDWGCGKGGMRLHVPPDRYRGIDGSLSPFADEIVDLAEYRSRVPGLFMRHVIEHDFRWAAILDNAVASFTERMVLVLFTPFRRVTQQLDFNSRFGVPNIAFNLQDITDRFGGLSWELETHATGTEYGVESVFYLERS